jgi:hypothetical protein
MSRSGTVAIGDELDGPFSAELERARLHHAVVERDLFVGIDGLGRLALETPNHRPIGVVALAGGGQRPEELAPDPNDLVEVVVLVELGEQQAGRPHGPHGV